MNQNYYPLLDIPELPTGYNSSGGHISMPPFGGQIAVLHGRIEGGDDTLDPARQRRPDGTSSSGTECSSHCADDTGRDDNVLERHHACLVGAQTLDSFRALD